MKIIIYSLIIMFFISCKKYELDKGFEDPDFIGTWVPYNENEVGGVNLNYYYKSKIELKKNGRFIETILTDNTIIYRKNGKIKKGKGIISVKDDIFKMEYGYRFQDNTIKEHQILRGPIIKDTVIISRYDYEDYFPIDDIRTYRGFILFKDGVAWYLE